MLSGDSGSASMSAASRSKSCGPQKSLDPPRKVPSEMCPRFVETSTTLNRLNTAPSTTASTCASSASISVARVVPTVMCISAPGFALFASSDVPPGFPVRNPIKDSTFCRLWNHVLPLHHLIQQAHGLTNVLHSGDVLQHLDAFCGYRAAGQQVDEGRITKVAIHQYLDELAIPRSASSEAVQRSGLLPSL